MKPNNKDYTRLINELRQECGDWLTADCVTRVADVADAIEVLLAERDALKAERDKWESAYKEITDTYVKIEETTVDKLKKVEAERDALLARLAPVDDEALVAIVLKEFIEATIDMPPRTTYTISKRSLDGARAAIAAIRPHIEAVERERCAKVAEKYENKKANYLLDASARAVATLWRMEIAAAIRSGK